MIAIETLEAPGAARAAVTALAELLLDAVAGGAEVSFLADITRAEAEAFWHGQMDRAESGQIIPFVARDAAHGLERILGCVLLEPIWKPNQPHRAEVAKLLVHSSARRRGIAKALMQALEARARAMGRSLITLDTAAGGTAPSLYRALGYQEFGALPAYALTPDGRLSDVIFFAKTL